MTRVYYDRVLEVSTTTGTGTFTVSGAVPGFQAFGAVCALGDEFDYAIFGVDGDGVPTGEWETGQGEFGSSNTLLRSVVHDSSAGSATAESFSAGTKYVALSYNARTVATGYVKLGQQRLSSAGDIEFTGIPGVYDDLVLVFDVTSDTTINSGQLRVQLSSDTGGNYDWQYSTRLGDAGPTYGATAIELGELPPAPTSGSVDGHLSGELTITDYAGTHVPKMLRGNSAARYVTSGGFGADIIAAHFAGGWNSASAVTAVRLYVSAGLLEVGSVATLYGRGG